MLKTKTGRTAGFGAAAIIAALGFAAAVSAPTPAAARVFVEFGFGFPIGFPFYYPPYPYPYPYPYPPPVYYPPPPYNPASGGDGMASDEQGRYYVTSALGVQVFDPTGRMCGVLPKPQPDKPLTSCALSGEGRAYLYVTNGDKIFRRKVQATGSIFYVAGKK